MIYSRSKKSFLAGRAVIKIILILIVVVVIVPVIFVLLSGSADIAYAKEYIATIQNHTAEAMVAKSIGDDIFAGRSKQTMTVVQKKITTVQKDLSELKVPEELNDYKTSVAAWVDEITQASSNTTFQSQKAAWGKISSSPKEVSVKLNKAQAKQSLQAGIQHIATAKQFGNYAVTTKNTEAMRSVSARLFAQGYWFKVLYKAYPGDICVDGGCLSVVWGEVPILQAVAFSLMEWTPDAEDKWENAWEGIVNDIKPSGISITGAGISEGKSAKQAVPEVAQTFFDKCKTGGGLVDDTGGVKVGLPTTEGGWTCWEPKKQCWHYLTYSGWFFRNGGPQPQACPEIDPAEFVIEGQTLGGAGSLTEVPEDEEESKTPANQPTSSWDGVYKIDFTPETCTAYGEYGTPVTSATDSEEVTVRNNQVVKNSKVSIKSAQSIDSTGRATVVYNISYPGITGYSTEQYTFSRGSNGEPTISVSWVGETQHPDDIRVRCTGAGGGHLTSE